MGTLQQLSQCEIPDLWQPAKYATLFVEHLVAQHIDLCDVWLDTDVFLGLAIKSFREDETGSDEKDPEPPAGRRRSVPFIGNFSMPYATLKSPSMLSLSKKIVRQISQPLASETSSSSGEPAENHSRRSTDSTGSMGSVNSCTSGK